MASSITLILVALVLPMVSATNIKHHTLRISEKGAFFKQATNVDVKNQIVYIHVPGHRNIPESRIMYEFNTGRVLRCNRIIQRCYLSNFDTQSAPDARKEEHDLKEFARKRTSPRKEERLEESSWQKMVVTEKIEDTGILTTRMRSVLGNYTLFREEPIPKGAKMLKGKLDLNNMPEKRNWRTSCSYPCTKYVYSAPDCDYVPLCSNVYNPSSCVLRHHNYIHHFTCTCCPRAWRPKDCIRCQVWSHKSDHRVIWL